MVFLFFCIVLLILVLAFFAYASYDVSSGIYVKTYNRKKTTEKEVALTFDDGPSAEYTPKILKVLDAWDVKAAFFCIGGNVEKNPEIVKKINENGHLIGNHSYSHISLFPLFSTRKMIDDLQKCDEALRKAVGKPVRFFRPPFGVTNPTVAKALKAFDYHTIGWDVRSFDTSTPSADKVVKRVMKKIRPGSVILLHDMLPDSEEILKKLLENLSEKKYKIIRVDKMFNHLN